MARSLAFCALLVVALFGTTLAARELSLQASTGLELVQNMAYLKPITNAPESVSAAIQEPVIDATMRRKLLQSGPLVDDLSVARSFQHGIASGDPTATQVILWTRVTPVAADTRALVYFKVAADSGLNTIVTQGAVATDAGVDWTVKVDVTGLTPSTTYYYQFYSGSAKSAVGRTRTLPVGDVSKSRIAYVTCSQYPDGYFNAYRSLAGEPDIQAVLHLGDYMYEYAASAAQATKFSPPRQVQAFQTVTLEQYRARHALYKTDVDLQEAHRVHPWVIVWDDHDSTNNAWRNGAQNHKTATQGPWEARLAASVRAWYEYQPVRQVQFDLKLRIYRSFQIGNLLDLIMVDTRIIGRDRQTDDPPDPPVLNTTAGNEKFAVLFDRTRTMLGETQLEWLQAQLSDSKGRGAVWRMIGNQVLFTEMPVTIDDPDTNGYLGPVIGYSDGWDAYPETRFQVLDHIRRNAIDNVVVATGDWHGTVVSDVPFYPFQTWGRSYLGNPNQNSTFGKLGVNANFTTGLGSMATEITVTSVTSAFFGETEAARASAVKLDDTLKSLMPHLRYSNHFGHGYAITEFTKTDATHTFCFVSTILSPTYTLDCSKKLKQLSGTNHLIDA
ncbi:alkaline phosphatase D [Klebsormidium nitens]|uniref:Alkaline phosphatase D n=1 Tax=Klebsormidium nitens TaxID=105231 RepID=A0A1Y1IF43_KLENI|nr:alkaline phosphatase D [Klebsormidium nitens]|eukprot:GAQ89233.1 alkaline phosphatase D [Klebsormidium nitens]